MFIPPAEYLGKDSKTPDSVKDIVKQREHQNADALFSREMSPKVKNVINTGLQHKDTLDDVDGGVINVEFNKYFINNDTAQVEAKVTKFITNRMVNDGKVFNHRIEGTDLVTYSFVKENGKWLIDKVSVKKDFDSVKSDLQPVK
jgi:hypothetical protein